MSDDDQKPNSINDLKARMEKLKAAPAPTSTVNPFASPLGGMGAAPSAPSNPFGASQLLGGQSNPFGAPASAPAPAPATSTANPFAAPAAPAPAAPAPAATGTANPFAAPAPAPAPAPASAPVAGGAASNPFGAPFAAQPEPAPAPAPAAAEGHSQAELSALAPLRFSAQEAAPMDELQRAAMSFDPSLTSKKSARFLAIGVGVAAMIIGLLIGSVSSERRAHNLRVVSWKNIDKQLSGPIAQLDQMQSLFGEMIPAKTILWDKLEALPEAKDLKIPDSSILAPPVPLSQPAMIELSSFVMLTAKLFEKVALHRQMTLNQRSSLEAAIEKRDFSQLGQYAIDAGDYLSKCPKRGACRTFQQLSAASARVVGLTALEVKDGKVTIITRDDASPRAVEVQDLIIVPRLDVIGVGGSDLQAYALRLKEIETLLNELVKLRRTFDKTLKERRTLEEV